MNTRRFLETVANSLVLFGLSGFAACPAQNRYGDATVTVCNQGRIDIHTVIGTEAALPLLAHNLDVVAWVSIKPGACSRVYHGVGDYDSGDGIEHSYLGFGFYNSQNQFIAGHAARLPDFGTFTYGTPILTAAGDRFCVRNTGIRYTIAEHAVLNCATFRSGANDPGGYTSFPTVLKILPRPWGCDDRLHTCSFGDFSLDVTATPTSAEIQITGRIGKDEQPDQSTEPGLGTRVMQQLANAAAERTQKLAQEQADAATQAQAQAEASRGSNVCVPDDLLAEWRNPPPGSKMEALQRELKASLRERAKSPRYDQSKWMTVDSSIYSTWNPAGPFRGVVTATDGGSCAVGHRAFLELTP
jgi:hypothetical protein